MYKYENRIAIFFDILGFRKWVNSEVENKGDDCTSIVEIFQFIKHFYADYTTSEYAKTVVVTFFSDSVIISFEETEEDQMFKTVTDLQILLFNLVIRGVLVRGAISHGKLLHNEDLILGPAFMSAYDLETKKSVVPRIICDPTVIGEAMKYKNSLDFREDLPYILDLFNEDIDGQLYVDYFDKIQEVFNDEKEYINYLLKLKTLIEKNLENSSDINVRAKYLWMKEKFNKVVEKRFSEPAPYIENEIIKLIEQIKPIH